MVIGVLGGDLVSRLLYARALSLGDIGDKLCKEGKLKCHWCSSELETNPRSYDHDDGVEVEGFERRQWVYFRCPGCGYDWSLRKLLGR